MAPTRPLVLVDDQRPHALAEVVGRQEAVHHPVLEPQAVGELELRARARSWAKATCTESGDLLCARSASCSAPKPLSPRRAGAMIVGQASAPPKQ